MIIIVRLPDGRFEHRDPGFHHSCLQNSPSEGRFYSSLFIHPFGGIHARVSGARVGQSCGGDDAVAQPEDPLLRTAYVDAVATLPAYQGQGIGSTPMRHLATSLLILSLPV